MVTVKALRQLSAKSLHVSTPLSYVRPVGPAAKTAIRVLERCVLEVNGLQAGLAQVAKHEDSPADHGGVLRLGLGVVSADRAPM